MMALPNDLAIASLPTGGHAVVYRVAVWHGFSGCRLYNRVVERNGSQWAKAPTCGITCKQGLGMPYLLQLVMGIKKRSHGAGRF